VRSVPRRHLGFPPALLLVIVAALLSGAGKAASVAAAPASPHAAAATPGEAPSSGAPRAGAASAADAAPPVLLDREGKKIAAPPPQPKGERLGAPPGSKHHLFLYLIDGLGALELPVGGYDRMTMTGLSTLMTEGLTYLSAYSVSPWTVPSVASILTSLYPSAHGLQRAGDRLPASAKTLAEVMKENGYESALFSAHPLVGALSGLDQGFDWIEEIPGPFGPAPPRGPGETSATLNRSILAWLDRRTSTAPVFLVILSGDPLEPFGAPAPEGRRFTDEAEYKWYSEIRAKLLRIRPGNLGMTTVADLKTLKADPDRFARAARNVYDSALYYNDAQLRSLKEALDARGYWKKALFVVTSTHGEDFGERGLFGHGASLYDTALRIPVVMSYPPILARPDQMRRTCDTVDLFPTILSMMGLPIPRGVQGIERNVEPTVATRLETQRPAFAETSPAGALPTGRASMICEMPTKLILNEEMPPGTTRPEAELFRASDPTGWEKRSVYQTAPIVAQQRRDFLEGWRLVKGKLQLAPDASAPSPDPRLHEVLRSLGYLQGLGPDPASGSAKKTAPGGEAASGKRDPKPPGGKSSAAGPAKPKN
jgi:arylsulfatase A-like enzyme